MLPPVARRWALQPTKSPLIPNLSPLALRPKLEMGPRENHVQHAKRSWVKCGWIGWHWGPPVVHRWSSRLAEEQNGMAVESPPCLHLHARCQEHLFWISRPPSEVRAKRPPQAGESLRDGGGQLVDLVLVVNVKNQRVVGGPTLEAVDLRYRIDIECGRSQSIHRFCGNPHNSPERR